MNGNEVEALLVGNRNTLKGDNNFCHKDGDKKYRYQMFRVSPEEVPEIAQALDAADTIIWRYNPAIEIQKDFESDQLIVRIRFAALKDGKQILICENKEWRD